MKTNDEILWQIAKRRASFKKQLLAYILVNLFLWAIWFVSGKPAGDNETLPFPAWVMLGWGVGLAMSFIRSYVVNNTNVIRDEYEKLKKQSK